MKERIVGGIYRNIIKKIFFLIDAETVHDFMTFTGEMLGKTDFGKWTIKQLFGYENRKLNKTIDGIEFKNPVGLPAGFDYNAKLPFILGCVGFGFETIGTVTLEPYEGNKKPRLGRFPKSRALLVNKGLKSIGADEIIKKLENKTFDIPIGISIGATNRSYKNEEEQIANYTEGFRLFENSKVKHSYYELNISCPNTFGGEPFTSCIKLEKLLKSLEKEKIKLPVYIKMPIDLDEKEIEKLLETESKYKFVKGVIFGNLTKDRNNPEVDPDDAEKWQEMKGNLSGKPTWNRSNKLIVLTKKLYKNRFTIIGCGGIFSAEDAVYKMGLGADMVQLITGMIYEGPQLIGEINKKLAKI